MSVPLRLQADVDVVISVGGLKFLTQGSGYPTDGTAGYCKGAIHADTTNAAVYVNKGTTTSCDFDAVSVA